MGWLWHTGAMTPETSSSNVDVEHARLTVSVNSETARQLREQARRQGITYAESIRRAVEVWAFFVGEQEAGNVIRIYDPKKKVTREYRML